MVNNLSLATYKIVNSQIFTLSCLKFNKTGKIDGMVEKWVSYKYIYIHGHYKWW